MFVATTVDATSTLFHVLGLKTPIRISSVAKGERFRPGSYFAIEDFGAVDGNGGRPYRSALDLRYCVPPMF
jgi:3-dehydroquinate dehydratase